MRMSDLIDRQLVIDLVGREFFTAYTPDERKAEVRALPSAEPERKHGEWLVLGGKCTKMIDKRIVECSVCGNALSMIGVNGGRGDANFCPNCGAKMDG